jgi:hypothetical protein
VLPFSSARTVIHVTMSNIYMSISAIRIPPSHNEQTQPEWALVDSRVHGEYPDELRVGRIRQRWDACELSVFMK